MSTTKKDGYEEVNPKHQKMETNIKDKGTTKWVVALLYVVASLALGMVLLLIVMTRLQKSIQDLNGKVESNAVEIAGMTTAILQLNIENQRMQGETHNLKKTYSRLEREKKDQRNQIAKEKESNDKKIQEVFEKISSLDNDAKASNEKITKLQETISRLQKENKDLQNQIAMGRESNDKKLLELLKSLNEVVKASNEKIAKLQEKSRLEKENQKLTDDLKSAKESSKYATAATKIVGKIVANVVGDKAGIIAEIVDLISK